MFRSAESGRTLNARDHAHASPGDEAYKLAREFVDGGSGDMYTRGSRAEGEQASRVSKAGVNADGGSGDMYTRAEGGQASRVSKAGFKSRQGGSECRWRIRRHVHQS